MNLDIKPKQKQASIWLLNITCLDHAYLIDASKTITGGSFMASFLVTGNIDPVESVVVDFSTLKNRIKSIIDDRSTGLDHKLWVFNSDHTVVIGSEGDPSVTLKSKYVELEVPENALFMVNNFSDYTLSNAQEIVRNLVQSALELDYPGINVTCFLSCKPDKLDFPGNSNSRMFSYTHGLKDSTSWACQNIAHGHLSFVTFFYPEDIPAENVSLIGSILDKFTDFIDRAVYVKYENIIDTNTDDNWVTVGYTTERGSFEAKYDLGYTKILSMDCETTIENLVEKLLANAGIVTDLKALGVTHVAMSEGLQKGALLNLGN